MLYSHVLVPDKLFGSTFYLHVIVREDVKRNRHMGFYMVNANHLRRCQGPQIMIKTCLLSGIQFCL